VETGRVSAAEFFKTKVLGILKGISYEDWLYRYIDHFELNPEGFELMLELKRKGRKVYLLSNLAEFHRAAIETKIPGFFDHFEKNFLSYQMGYHKPESGIYRMLCDRLGDRPESFVFFDDVQVNVDGAICSGMKSIRFSNDRIDLIRSWIEDLEGTNELQEGRKMERIKDQE